jgi:hypothetical protein
MYLYSIIELLPLVSCFVNALFRDGWGGGGCSDMSSVAVRN